MVLSTNDVCNVNQTWWHDLVKENGTLLRNCSWSGTTICHTGYKGKDASHKSFVARKLTSDIYPSIINNAYFKPSYKTPYYTITHLSENAVLVEKMLDPCNEAVVNDILFPCEGEE